MVLKVSMGLRVIKGKGQVIICTIMISSHEVHCVGFKRYER